MTPSEQALIDIAEKHMAGVTERQTAAVLGYLNSAFAADPAAIHALVAHHVPCNDALRDHPQIEVQLNRAIHSAQTIVTTVGLLNGLLHALLIPDIELDFQDESDGRRMLKGFRLRPKGKVPDVDTNA